MASESDSRSSSAADSYVGSLISLTSKSEIRYEGVLYNINTEESSIGLRNVRSFGTEGRKKDGPQVPPSDQVFEYILFRGSDIKDLQVKSSPPVQTTSLINNDPAIIQSHYPRPVSIPSSLPPPVSGPLPDINSQAMPMGIPGSNFQSGLPLYQPGGNVGSWGASPSQPPPNPSAGGLGLPMYWQGYYGHPNGLPHMHQQSLLRPPPGLSLPSSLQQPLQYPNLNAYLPTGAPNPLEVSSSLFSANPTAPSLSSTAMPPVTVSSTLPSVLSVPQTPEMSSSSMVNKTINSALPQAPISTNLTSLSSLTASLDVSPVVPPTINKTTTVSGPALSYQTVSQSTSSIIGTSNSVLSSAPAPALVTPDQLLHTTVVSSSLPSQTVQKDVEVIQASSSLAAEQTVPVPADTQPPLLPLPTSSRVVQKPNGSTSQTRHIYRGRGRGRRFGNQHPTEKFTEDFDFMAMNEKFNKDEVWGHLGKNTKSPKYNDGDEKFSDEDDDYEEDDGESSKLGIKSVYNKDDFFDTLSSNTTNNEAQNGRRTRYFEQIKLDTETFGEFARYRGGRGGFGSGRGGRRGGYYGRGYGHGGRGRGRGLVFKSNSVYSTAEPQFLCPRFAQPTNLCTRSRVKIVELQAAFSVSMAAALPSLAPLLIFARILGLLVAVLIFVWALAFSSSFGHLPPAPDDRIFDVLHPLFMVIGFILLSGEAILVHSWLPGSRNLRKSVHLILQGLALTSGFFGIWTKFHWDRGFLANFHSVHSWLGLSVFTLFGAQWMMGFLSFWHWREVRATRERVLPWHVFLGLYSYALAVTVAETGLLEKLTLLQTKRHVPRKGPEAMVVNSLGLALALLGGTVVLTAISPKYTPSLPTIKQPFVSNSKPLSS